MEDIKDVGSISLLLLFLASWIDDFKRHSSKCHSAQSTLSVWTKRVESVTKEA